MPVSFKNKKRRKNQRKRSSIRRTGGEVIITPETSRFYKVTGTATHKKIELIEGIPQDYAVNSKTEAKQTEEGIEKNENSSNLEETKKYDYGFDINKTIDRLKKQSTFDQSTFLTEINAVLKEIDTNLNQETTSNETLTEIHKKYLETYSKIIGSLVKVSTTTQEGGGHELESTQKTHKVLYNLYAYFTVILDSISNSWFIKKIQHIISTREYDKKKVFDNIRSNMGINTDDSIKSLDDYLNQLFLLEKHEIPNKILNDLLKEIQAQESEFEPNTHSDFKKISSYLSSNNQDTTHKFKSVYDLSNIVAFYLSKRFEIIYQQIKNALDNKTADIKPYNYTNDINFLNKIIIVIDYFIRHFINNISIITKYMSNNDLKRQLQDYSSSQVITYVKIRDNIKNGFNPRYIYYIDDENTSKLITQTDITMVKNSTLSLLYCNENSKSYKFPEPNAGEQSSGEIVPYDHLFHFGRFDTIFYNNDNKHFGENMEKVRKNLEDGKSVFIIGYGASGAGKTTTLIYDKTNSTNKDGAIVYMLNTLAGEKEKFRKITLTITEAFLDTKQIDRIQTIVKIENIQFTYNEHGMFVCNKDDLMNKHNEQRGHYSDYPEIFIPEIENYGSGDDDLLLSKVLKKLIDERRMVQATSNNPQSSRSHVIATIQIGDTQQKLYIGDFAGVENKFDYNIDFNKLQEEVEQKTKDIKQSGTGSEYTLSFDTDVNISVTTPENIDIATMNKILHELTKKSLITKDVYDMSTMKRVNDNDEDTDEYFYQPYSASDVGNQINEDARNQLVKGMIKTLNETYNDKYKFTEKNFVVNDNKATLQDSQSEIDKEIKYLKHIKKDNPEQVVDKDGKTEYFTYGKNPYGEEYKTGNIKTGYDFSMNLKISGSGTKNHHIYLKISVTDLNLPVSSQVNINFSLFKDNVQITSSSNMIKDMGVTVGKDRNTFRDFFVKITNGPNKMTQIKKDMESLSFLDPNDDSEQSYFTFVNLQKKVTELISKYRKDKEEKINKVLQDITKRITQLESEKSTMDEETSNKKQKERAVKNIKAQIINRIYQIHAEVVKRAYEGVFINKALEEMRNTMTKVLQSQIGPNASLVPNFNDKCSSYYATPLLEDTFFTKQHSSDPASTNSPMPKYNVIHDIINGTIQTSVGGGGYGGGSTQQNATMYKDLIYCICLVVNNSYYLSEKDKSILVNNPPKIPYIDLTEGYYELARFKKRDLKIDHHKNILFKTHLLGVKRSSIANQSITTEQKLIDDEVQLSITELIGYDYDNFTNPDVNIEIFKDISEYVQKCYMNSIKNGTIAESKLTQITEAYNNIISEDERSKKISIIEQFLFAIETMNATSVIGTLDFADQISKYNLGYNSCSVVQKHFKPKHILFEDDSFLYNQTNEFLKEFVNNKGRTYGYSFIASGDKMRRYYNQLVLPSIKKLSPDGSSVLKNLIENKFKSTSGGSGKHRNTIGVSSYVSKIQRKSYKNKKNRRQYLKHTRRTKKKNMKINKKHLLSRTARV